MEVSKSGLENIFLKETPKTPKVDFKKDGKMEISGVSLPYNSIIFYKPLLNWVEEYSKNPADLTKLNIKFKYFNPSSSKCILDMFKKIEYIHKAKGGVVVNWYYGEDDKDILEAGEDFESIICVPFKMLKISDWLIL